MVTSVYQKILEDICTLAEIPASSLMYQDVNLTVDRVDFTIRDATLGDEAALVLYCDFGPLPSTAREQVLERLLQVNLATHGLNAPLFAQNPENGHVLLARRVVLTRLRALDVMNLLAEHATHARQWRNGYYLRDDKAAARGKSRTHLLLANAGGLQRA